MPLAINSIESSLQTQLKTGAIRYKPNNRNHKYPTTSICWSLARYTKRDKNQCLMHTIDRQQIQYRITIVRTQFDKRSHQLDSIAHEHRRFLEHRGKKHQQQQRHGIIEQKWRKIKQNKYGWIKKDGKICQRDMAGEREKNETLDVIDNGSLQINCLSFFTEKKTFFFSTLLQATFYCVHLIHRIEIIPKHDSSFKCALMKYCNLSPSLSSSLSPHF